MDRRTLIALGLMAIVIVLTPILLPGASKLNGRADSAAVAAARADSVRGAASVTAPATTPATPTIGAAPTPVATSAVAPVARVVAESVVVNAPRSQLVVANPGG